MKENTAEVEKKKTVSVVVSTFRREAVLMRALRSIAGQTMRDFEVVVVDDNGDLAWNQKAEAIVDEFKTEYPWIPIKYIQNSVNLGSAQARNCGVAAADGEYVTFLDDDDVYLPQKICRQLEYMQTNAIDYCAEDIALYYEDETLSEKRIRGDISGLNSEMLLRYHFMHHITGTDTMMFRKAYLEQIGGFPPIDVGDEFYLLHRAIEAGGKFGYLSCCDVKAYIHTGNGGLSSGKGKIDGENALYQYKKKYFPLFDRKSIRYIRMRHYAVLAFASIRSRDFLWSFLYGVLGFFSAPVQCLCFLKDRYKNAN